MTQVVKKAKAPSKPRKATTKRTGIAMVPNPPVLSHDEVAKLAHRFWAERGHQHGTHEADWFRAEQELRGKAS
jgi:hypothetical protein